MRKIRAALGGLIMCIWIAAAAGCSSQNTDQPASADGAQLCWAAVTLEGGSGRASVDSPCPVVERPDSGELTALITWSSSHYDYMVVNGEKLLPVNSEGNSQFEIPLGEDAGSGLPDDRTLQVQADTTAMSTPHLIDYTLSFRFYETQEEAEKAGDGTVSTAEPSAGSEQSGTAESGEEEQAESGEEDPEAATGGDPGPAPEIPGLICCPFCGRRPPLSDRAGGRGDPGSHRRGG